MSRSRRIWYGLGILAFGAALAGALDLWQRPFGHDYGAYVLAARHLAEGSPLYPREVVLGPFGQFLYPPLVAAAFLPFSADPRAGAQVWMLALLGMAVAYAWTLVRTHGIADRPWVAAGVIFFPPLVWDLTLGNVTLLACAAVLLAWRIRVRPVVAGVLIAVSIALKPLAAVAFIVWLLTGQWRAVLWAAATGAAGVALTWPWLAESWLDYPRVLLAVATAAPGTGSNILPVAFSGQPARSLLPLLALCTALAAGLAARHGAVRPGHAFLLALAAGPLVSSTLWYPYLIFAQPLLVQPGSMAGLWWERRSVRIARVFCWALMLAQFFGEPGRDFLLPLLGLIALVLLGLLPVAAGLRGAAPRWSPRLSQ